MLLMHHNLAAIASSELCTGIAGQKYENFSVRAKIQYEEYLMSWVGLMRVELKLLCSRGLPSEKVYKNVALRPFADMDLLVERNA